MSSRLPVLSPPAALWDGEAEAAREADWLPAPAVRLRVREITELARAMPDGGLAELVAVAEEAHAARAEIRARAEALRAEVGALPPAGRLPLLRAHLQQTVAHPWARLMDRWALRGSLDLDALLEREAERMEAPGARLELILLALPGALGELDPADRAEALVASGALDLLHATLEAELRPPNRRAAASALVQALGAVEALDAPEALAMLRARSLDPTEEIWVARRALDGAALCEAAPRADWLRAALQRTEGQDAFLLRARALELALVADSPIPRAELFAFKEDPSSLVRFTLAEGLTHAILRGEMLAEEALADLLLFDPDPDVRAWVAACLAAAGEPALTLLSRALLAEPEVAGFALDGLADHLLEPDAPPPSQLLIEVLKATVDAVGPPSLRRRAFEILAIARGLRDPLAALAKQLAELCEGGEQVLTLPEGVEAEELARALVPYATQGFGFALAPLEGGRLRVRRGDTLCFAPWRLLHELRHESPYKRQGHTHTRGRADDGPIRIPPSRLFEDSPTGVPGQRVSSAAQGSWVPTLPMVEDYLHAAARGELRIVSAEGTTVIEAPRGRVARLKARLRLVLGFHAYDLARTTALDARDPRAGRGFVEGLAGLGFDTQLESRRGGAPSEGLFQSRVEPLIYLFSLRANSRAQLARALAVLGPAFVLPGGVARWRVRRIRRRLPLVIGGWGTRGKSGTERLKAALVESLGYPYLSKTTGCEAMVLHAPPGGRARELFLFRPFDKATIWEQIDVAELAVKLDSRVMLWECMGLQPAYVELLQQHWMRDDLSTITNAYADHEDVMGPTGLDVARVISGFIPRGSRAITTEGPMLPILVDQARRQGSTLHAIGRARRALIPADLMARFPPEEHRATVARAAAGAEAPAVERVEAIGLMAERVLPDLGALVIYPEATHMGRRVRFANGMSANDEVSFRHSWSQARMDRHRADPLDWRMTVVNNRADRVPRSRAFARALVEHASVHRHVLIGTNLEGLSTYFREALAERVARLPDEAGPEEIERLLSRLLLPEPSPLGEALARRHGARRALVVDWAAALASWEDPDPADLPTLRQSATCLQPAAHALAQGCQRPALAQALVEAAVRHRLVARARTGGAAQARAAFVQIFMASLVFVRDPGTSGDQILARCLAEIPDGASLRLFGAQNIKGTGLDFAYLWVWWRQAHEALGQLAGAPGPTRTEAMERLEGLPIKSLLVAEAVIAGLQPLFEDPELGTRARRLHERASSTSEALARARTEGVGRSSSWWVRLLERLLDPFDAILRAWRGRRLLRLLAKRRISHPRVQAELAALTARQKGGWLGK